MIEGGEARVAGNGFDLNDSIDHHDKGMGVPVVYVGDLDVHSMPGRNPFPEGCASGSGAESCQQVVTTRGRAFLVHGRLLMNIGPQGRPNSIESEKYDFNHDPNASLKRNVETFVGGVIHGEGTPFTIHYDTTPTLQPGVGIGHPPLIGWR